MTATRQSEHSRKDAEMLNEPRNGASLTTERIVAGQRLIDDLRDRGVTARLLGGVGVSLHCRGAAGTDPHREIGDLDAVVSKADARALAKALPELGYAAEARFNAMHGGHRLIFHGPTGKLDVFVEAFRMCHELRLGDRLDLDYPTITVSDLLITKLQIVELNAKDVQDASLLLAEHDLGEGPGDHIDVKYLSRLVGHDWGLWRTTIGTLETLAQRGAAGRATAERLRTVLREAPKSRAFRLRARVGERVQWYDLPDDRG
jgi:hypothetical protein